MGDVNDDGVYDLVAGAGKDHAPEVVAYSGRAAGGKYAFETELARFEAFDSAARGSVSVAALPVDGSTADNIIVGSGRSVGFGEMASFTPFDGEAGVTVATTSTTHGADLLVSGVLARDKTAQVVKYQLVRPSPQATNMLVKKLGTVVSKAGSVPNVLGGD